MTVSWQEVEQARSEKRRELVIAGPQFSERIEKHGLDPGIFKLLHLNFLEIAKAGLKVLPADIGSLVNLNRLLLSDNGLESLPSDLGLLKKLKFLDVSRNAIAALPAEVSQLTEVQSLNFSMNMLSELPALSDMVHLVTLNISHNEFEALPSLDPKLIHFSELLANNNRISALPATLHLLPSLKVLDLGCNAVASVPGQLGSCGKLRDLHLQGNPLRDKRLLKLVEQCHTRQVLEYVRGHCPMDGAEGTGKGKGKGKKERKQGRKDDAEEVTAMLDELKISHASDEGLKVVTTSKVDVRPYIVCCRVLQTDLTEPGLLKKFISAQTKLHDTVCEKRTLATIATHDFSKIQGDLRYDARPPEDITIFPLNRKKEATAASLYAQLNDEADAIRKEKKKNTYSGVHKYLYLLKDKPLYPCLMDSSGTVISFPPITNSEVTKISEDTKSMLLEVTGGSLPNCKKAMDALISEILHLGLGEKGEGERRVLRVQQVKVVDEEGKLKVVYPSRTDMQTEGIVVTRE